MPNALKSPLFSRWFGPVCCVVLLGALLGLNALHLTPADASGYHQNVADRVLAVDYTLADWEGRDIEVPPAAVKLLRPNVLLSRQYTNEQGEMFSVLIVHCKDARDLLGHYPPVCYPAQGWRLADSQLVPPVLTPLAEAEMQYRFTAEIDRGSRMIYVRQLFVLPDGTLSSDMADVEAVADDFNIRHYGGMQIQVVSSKDFTDFEVASRLAQELNPVLAAVPIPASEASPSQPSPQTGLSQ